MKVPTCERKRTRFLFVVLGGYGFSKSNYKNRRVKTFRIFDFGVSPNNVTSNDLFFVFIEFNLGYTNQTPQSS